MNHGAQALTDAELIAILLRTGTRKQDGLESDAPNVLQLAEHLLRLGGGLHGALSLSSRELYEVHGLGDTKTATLLAVREITERLFRRRIGPSAAVHGMQDAYQLFLDLILEEQEVLSAAYLDPRNRLIHRENIFRGTMTFAMTSPREILRVGLRVNAASLLIAHNHPSQDPTPSPDDHEFTMQMQEACKLVGMHFLDHLVVCAGNNFVSILSGCEFGRSTRKGDISGLTAKNAVAND